MSFKLAMCLHPAYFQIFNRFSLSDVTWYTFSNTCTYPNKCIVFFIAIGFALSLYLSALCSLNATHIFCINWLNLLIPSTVIHSSFLQRYRLKIQFIDTLKKPIPNWWSYLNRGKKKQHTQIKKKLGVFNFLYNRTITWNSCGNYTKENGCLCLLNE